MAKASLDVVDVSNVFIREDWWGDDGVWLENGDYPILLVSRYEMPPKVWEILAAVVPTKEPVAA